MFFYASKIIGALVWPSSVVTLLLIGGTMLLLAGRALRWARITLMLGTSLLLLCGLSPLGNWLMLPLEQRFARAPLPGEIAGIIMLGGFEAGGISRDRGQLSLNEGAERLTEAILLARQRPSAKVIFTGGDGSLVGERVSAAGPVAAYLEAVGIARERLVLEGASRTTHENAAFLAAMIRPRPADRYVLVTSAFHMPRAVGTFRRNGFDVIPWPADYRTSGVGAAFELFTSVPAGLERVDLAFKEWLGLLAYRLSGRTEALWPAPQSPTRSLPPPVQQPGAQASPVR